MTDFDKIKLYQILRMQIQEREEKGFVIDYSAKIIYSGQQYYGKFDPDMSDVAVAFYEKIYGIEESKLLDKNCKMFKGDTINSNIKYYKTNKDDWNSQKKYCLANFWVIPMNLGRTPVRYLEEDEKKLCKHSKYSRIHDYMDVFLEYLNNNKKLYFEKYESYFKDMGIKESEFLESFSDVHFLEGSYIVNNTVELLDKGAFKDNGYTPWINRLEKRADKIVEKRYTELKELFRNNIKEKI